MGPELDIERREREGIEILDLRGRVTIGGSERVLREAVEAAARRGMVKVILNFSGVNEMDEDGISALVYCEAWLSEQGGALKLFNLHEGGLELMLMTKLDSVFEAFAEEQDAVDSFFPDRQAKRYDILEFVRERERERE